MNSHLIWKNKDDTNMNYNSHWRKKVGECPDHWNMAPSCLVSLTWFSNKQCQSFLRCGSSSNELSYGGGAEISKIQQMEWLLF